MQVWLFSCVFVAVNMILKHFFLYQMIKDIYSFLDTMAQKNLEGMLETMC